MKIKYIKLENFIGIYIGTGRYKFEIDFEQSKNRIVMLEGHNGSGKTSLLSTLHPFAGTMDERKEIILEGKTGKKEIIISHDGYEYDIVHHYKPLKNNKRSIASYIGKRKEGSQDDWEELNETGTVNSFKDILLEELDVDESFFRLSRIGSNVTNFIDLKTAERKKYLSLFLSEVDEYLHYYKIVGDKYNKTNLLLKSVVEDINKLGSEDDLNMTKEGLESRIKSNQKSYDKNILDISKNQGSINEIDSDGNISSRYDELTEEIENLEEEIEACDVKIERVLSQNPSLAEVDDMSEKLVSIERKKASSESKKSSIMDTLDRIRTSIEENNKKLKEKTSQREKFKTKETLDELEESRDEYQTKINNNINEIDEDFSAYKKFKATSENDQTINTKFLNDFINKRENFLNTSSLDAINKVFEIIDKYGDEKAESMIKSLKDHADVALKKSKEKHMQITNSIAFMDKERKLLSSLAKRPANCKIDSCPFIADAIKVGDVDSRIKTATDRLDEINNSISSNEKNVEHAEEVLSAYLKLQSIFDYLDSMESIMSKFPVWKVLHNKSISEMIYYSEDKLRRVVEKFNHYASLIEDNKNLEKSLDEINNKIEMLSSNKEFLESIDRDIFDLTKSIEELTLQENTSSDELTLVTKKITTCERIISDLKIIIDLNKQKSEAKDRIKENKKTLHDMDDKVQKISKYKRKIEELEESNEEIESYLIPDKEKLEEIKIKLAKIKDYENKKIELDEKFYNYGILRDALSPTKGIPLIFLNVYLKKTKDICNNLLNIAYNGELQIVDFDISESDFFIKVRRNNGEVLNDVSIASQGEQALISVAISFALIEQSMKKYNIILLDEIDSTLDQSNRRSFIDILDAQLDALHVEQAFIISHNKEFDSSPVDLILMKGHETDLKSLKKTGIDKTVLFKI